MLVVLIVAIFAPGRLPLSAGLSAYLDIYGTRLLWTLPEGAVDPNSRVTLVRALYSFAVIEAPAIIIGVYQLKKILEKVAERSPFVMENAIRVRILGLTIIGSALLRFVRSAIFGSLVVDIVPFRELSLTAHPAFKELDATLYGFVVLLLAEIFRYGIRLQEEADLTV